MAGSIIGPLVSWTRMRWKHVVLVICLFVLYAVIFANALPADSGAAFLGSLSATVLTVFVYGRIAKKIGL